MNQATVILIFALYVVGSMAQNGQDMKAIFRKARKTCNEGKVSPKILEQIKTSLVIKDRSVMNEDAQCFLECLMIETGMATKEKIHVSKLVKFVESLGKEQSSIQVAANAITLCGEDVKQPAGTKCPVGAHCKACEHERSKDMSLLHFFLKV